MLLMDAKLYILASIIRGFGAKPLQVEVRGRSPRKILNKLSIFGQFFAIIWTHFDYELDSSTLDHNINIKT